LADGAGPAQGREHEGPTAAILSTTSWDHRRALGGLVYNAKFTRTFLKNPANRAALSAMIETYLRRGGFEIQINVVSNADLRDAQRHPDQYQDLIVRIAGYSDYFVHLGPQMQEELIQRTAFSRM
jgi:formate C-acetyltransferase